MGSIQSPHRTAQRYDRNRTRSPRSPKRDTRRDSKYSPRRSPRQRERSEGTRSRSEQRWQPRPRPEREFTKLNTDKATVLAVLKTEPDYRPPRPMKPGRPPSSQYCEYDEDTGHTTEQCFQLSNSIENKIRRGKLVHFTDKDAPIPRENQRDDDRVIDVIFGGVASGGLSNNSRKSYAREIFNINPEVVKRPMIKVKPKKGDSNDHSINQVAEVDPQHIAETNRSSACTPIGDTVDIKVIEGRPDRTTKIRKDLPDTLKTEIVKLIRQYSDIFAWDPKDMPGIPEIIA